MSLMTGSRVPRVMCTALGDRQVRIYLKIDIFENGVVCDTVSVLV